MDPPLLQRSNELEAGGIADVRQPRIGVPAEVALAGQPLRRPVEDSAPLFELANPVRRLLGMDLRHPPVSEVLASLHGVTEMGLPRVPVVLVGEGRGSAALSHHSVGLAQHRLTDHGHADSRCAGLDSGPQPSSSSADDDNVMLMHHDVFHQTPPHRMISVHQPMVQA